MTLISDLNSLVEQRKGKTLADLKPRGGITGESKSSTYKAKTTQTAGIASPLTEKTTTDANGKTALTRTYWPGGLPSNDGLLVLPAIKSLVLVDANKAEVTVNLADPAIEQ